MEHLVLSVVEAERVPLVVLSSIARIEILVWVSREVSKTFNLVLYSM